MRTQDAPVAPTGVHELFVEIDALTRRVVARSRDRFRAWAPQIARETFVPSAHNLAAYLALREIDLRDVQARLVPVGLSSLGRCEGHVGATLAAVRATLGILDGGSAAVYRHPHPRDFALGDWLLARNTRAIFGDVAPLRPHIMVTLGLDAARDPDVARRLIENGMDCARINCAHDSAIEWCAMAANVRHASAALRRPCRIYADLAGPKLRIARVEPNDPARRFSLGESVEVWCAEPGVLAHVPEGAKLWIDDGKIGAVVRTTHAESLVVEIDRVAPGGAKIRIDKGLNFPGTRLEVPVLGPKDLADLDWIARDADIVGQSFVRDPSDVRALRTALAARGADLPTIAKLETGAAIEALPEILVAGAGTSAFGVMIARGDLAVEIGYRRLAELQEEILWLCEAAHVPVVWATDVLDRFVRKGVPARAEITDAAMAERAECVMLNKGPFVAEAVAILADVLTRMQGHQIKKSSQLRALHAWPMRNVPATQA